MAIAERESNIFFDYAKRILCEQSSCKEDFTFDKLTENDLDTITTHVLKWVWSRVSPPLSLEEEVLPFYQEIKKECFFSNDPSN